MKRIILPAFLAIGSLAGLSAKAQTANATATANVSVTLSAILDIHIGGPSATSTNVAIPPFNSADAYQNGVPLPTISDHLYVVASKGFTVQASATDLSDGTHTISAGGINIVPSDGTQGSTNKPSGTAYTNLNLSNSAQSFITATGGTPLYKFSVTYTLGGGTRAAYFIGKEPGDYQSTVTYTIIP